MCSSQLSHDKDILVMYDMQLSHDKDILVMYDMLCVKNEIENIIGKVCIIIDIDIL